MSLNASKKIQVVFDDDNLQLRSKIIIISYSQVEQHRKYFPKSINSQNALAICSSFHRKYLAVLPVLSDARQHSCTAIKTLETKVDNLIALVKDALPRKPSGTFSMVLGYINVFIFQVFSTRSDLKMAVLFFSQPVTSPLARNSSTRESKYRAINCKIPNN